MLRIASRVSSVRICLVSQSCRQLYISPRAAGGRERVPCPPPPVPPPPPPRDTRLVWGVASILLLTGATAVYAKTSPEFRDWLSIYAPWFDDLIAAAYQENMSYTELARELCDDARKRWLNYKDDGPKQCSTDGAPVTTVQLAPEAVKEDEKGSVKEACEPPPLLSTDVCDIEACLKQLADTALQNYTDARDACVHYNKLAEQTMVQFTLKGARQLQQVMAERRQRVQRALEHAATADCKLDAMSKYLECGLQMPPAELKNTRALLKEYQDKIKTVRLHYQWANDTALALDAHTHKVVGVVDKYTAESQAMFRGLHYDSDKPALTGDADLLLHHSKRYIEQLQSDLCEAVCAMTDRVDRALETLPQGEKQKKARDAEIQYQYKRRKADLDTDYKKRLDDQKAANDKLLKDSLKKQHERHLETLHTKLAQKEIEATSRLNALVSDKVSAEKRLMSRQLADMRQKLNQVETKLNARLRAARESRRSQQLWRAAQALLSATAGAGDRVRVDQLITDIEKASGEDDKLVASVLKAIPASVREHGLVPETALRHNYRAMESVALKVALVEQEGAALPVYLLSWLQYLLLFMKISGIPQEEYEKPPREPPKDLDTFDLLQRARFWVSRGEVSLALRYVSALQGASLAAALGWRAAAADLLAARQAAQAVRAHAAALAQQYV